MVLLRCSECDDGWVPDPNDEQNSSPGCKACGSIPVFIYHSARRRRHKNPHGPRISRVSGFYGRWQIWKGHYVPGSYVPPDPDMSGSGLAGAEPCVWELGRSSFDRLGSHIRRELSGSWRLYKGDPYKIRRPRDRRPKTDFESERELGKESDTYMDYLRENPEAKWDLLRDNPEKFKDMFPDDYDEWYRESDTKFEDEEEEPLGN